jgi:hypothetical protein
MKICASISEVETHWPSPVRSRSSSAMHDRRSRADRPADVSLIAMPTRTGPPPACR